MQQHAEPATLFSNTTKQKHSVCDLWLAPDPYSLPFSQRTRTKPKPKRPRKAVALPTTASGKAPLVEETA